MQQNFDLGSARVTPADPVVAGSYATLTHTYTAGHPIDDSGSVKIAFRSVGDFGTPQFDDPSAPNYCTIRTTGDCLIVPRWDTKGHTRPWTHTLYLKVTRGYLNRGEQLIVVFGEVSGGSPGWRMITYCEDTWEFKTLVDPIATFEFKELPESPTLRIVPGRASRAVCIGPSQVLASQPFSYYLKLEDEWGNPTAEPIAIQHAGLLEVGTYRLKATDPETGLSATSNPIDVLAEKPPLNPYWADFHGQTEETCGTNTIDDYYAFARKYGFLDICAHQGNDFEVSDDFWLRVNERAGHYYEPGRFVTYPGYEWSGNTPLGGDRNVYFGTEDGRIVHSCTDLLPDKETIHPLGPTATELFVELSKQKESQPFAFAHIGGRYADVSMHDESIELAMEIHSAWGTFEWLLEDALRRGYRVGICANSDGHKTHPGASYPGASQFGSLGGLTCVLAPRLDRRSILEALRARHFFATTGHRPLLDVCLVLEDGRTAMMGDIVKYSGGSVRVKVRAAGSAPIEKVILRNGLGTLAVRRSYEGESLGKRIKVVWSGSEVPGRARMVSWDGGLQVKGNALTDAAPINFWRADQQPQLESPHRIAWKSVTTGGVTGLILTLAEKDAGTLEIDTAQGKMACQIGEIGLEPMVWEYGGLRKQLEVYRLPDELPTFEVSLDLPVTDLRQGDNPLYVRVDQVDGHMAWSSPVYVVRR